MSRKYGGLGTASVNGGTLAECQQGAPAQRKEIFFGNRPPAHRLQVGLLGHNEMEPRAGLPALTQPTALDDGVGASSQVRSGWEDHCRVWRGAPANVQLHR